MAKLKTFLTDADGISMKDWLMLLSSTVFFLFITIGLIMSLFGNSIDPVYLDLLDTVSPVIITITSGVFGVNAVETFVNRKRDKKYKDETEEELTQEDIDMRI